MYIQQQSVYIKYDCNIHKENTNRLSVNFLSQLRWWSTQPVFLFLINYYLLFIKNDSCSIPISLKGSVSGYQSQNKMEGGSVGLEDRRSIIPSNKKLHRLGIKLKVSKNKIKQNLDLPAQMKRTIYKGKQISFFCRS